MKTVWIILISVIVTGGLIGGGTYYFMNSRAIKDKDDLQSQITSLNKKVADTEKSVAEATALAQSTAQTTTTTTPAATSTTSNWKSYANPTYGFNLTLTDDWKDYSTYDETPAGGNAIKYIRFLLPTTESAFFDKANFGKDGVVSPFTIGVYTISGYAKEKADAEKDGAPFDQSIGQNNKYVFTWGSWQDSPSDLRDKDLAFETIKASLKVSSLK